jgi:hypothetical protein
MCTTCKCMHRPLGIEGVAASEDELVVMTVKRPPALDAPHVLNRYWYAPML